MNIQRQTEREKGTTLVRNSALAVAGGAHGDYYLPSRCFIYEVENHSSRLHSKCISQQPLTSCGENIKDLPIFIIRLFAVFLSLFLAKYIYFDCQIQASLYCPFPVVSDQISVCTKYVNIKSTTVYVPIPTTGEKAQHSAYSVSVWFPNENMC